jgi:PKD repeat protein
MSGTSMASPMVSGLLGLMISLNPGIPQQDVVNCLISSCDNINAANPSYIGDLGNGRINAFAALNCVSATLNNPPVADFSANYTNITAGSSVTFTDLSTYNPTSWTWNFDNQNIGGVTPSTFIGQTPPPVTYANPGVYEVSLTVSNANGTDTEIKTAYITVDSASSCEIVYLDTNGYPLHFGWTPTLYTVSSPGGGYVAGVNSYDDLAKAEYFSNATTGAYQYLVGTYIWFGKMYSANSSKTVDINVWDGTGGTPGAILATKTMTIAELQAGGSIPFIEFDNAVPIPASGEIFVGIDISNLSYSANDSLAIVTNASGESQINTAWEKWSDNTWHAYSETNSWNISLSHYIMPWLTNDTTAAIITASSTTVCEGDIVNFDASGSTFQDTLVWTFIGGSPNNSVNIQQSVAYNNAGTYTAYLEVIGGGCSLYEIDSITITVNPMPVVSVSATTDSLCLGDTVTINASGANTYSWTPGGQTTSSITTSPSTTTTYTVTGTSSGCSNVNSITIYVTDIPVAAATYSPSLVCPGQTVVFDGTSTTNPGTYTWIFSSGSPSIPSASGPFASVSFNSSGTHPYSLITTNKCGADTLNSTITIDVCTSVNNLTENELFNAYFSNSNLVLNVASLNNGNYQLKLINSLGQLIYNENITLNNNQSILVETNNLSNGLYFVHLQNEQSQYIVKLIK